MLLGGADFHMQSQGVGPGTPTTWVAAEDASPEAILAGVAAGRTAIMGGVTVRDGLTAPDLFTAPVLLRIEDELLAIDADGLILVDGAGERRSVHGDRVAFPGRALRRPPLPAVPRPQHRRSVRLTGRTPHTFPQRIRSPRP